MDGVRFDSATGPPPSQWPLVGNARLTQVLRPTPPALMDARLRWGVGREARDSPWLGLKMLPRKGRLLRPITGVRGERNPPHRRSCAQLVAFQGDCGVAVNIAGCGPADSGSNPLSHPTECSVARSTHVIWDHVIVGSNPTAPTTGCTSVR